VPVSVFTDERLEAMRKAAEQGLRNDRMFGCARFTATLRAEEEQVVVVVVVVLAGGQSHIEATEPIGSDFSLQAPAPTWERYFSGDGSALYSSILGLMTASDCTGGVLASEIVPDGDLVRLFANLPILTRLLESAAQPGKG